MKRIGQLQTIVANHQAGLVHNQWVDATTAEMLIVVYNALSPENQDRFDSIPLRQLIDFGWKHVRAA